MASGQDEGYEIILDVRGKTAADPLQGLTMMMAPQAPTD
jgi:hypothetical protein